MAVDISINSLNDLKEGPGDYERHLEWSVLRNAVGSGYFKDLAVDDLLGQFHEADHINGGACTGVREDPHKNEKHITLESINKLDFNSSRLRAIGPVSLCANLTICNLSGNFISRIDPLKTCRSLVKIDVHHNQIMELPNEDFWHALDKLQVVYLHDNGICTFDEVAKMCATKCLLMLTMYDTPASLKMHYRHFITNSIWSLKVLDNVIISDEEIIEDAKFCQKFCQSQQPHFTFTPKSLESKKHWTLVDEKRALYEDIAHVNKIQARYSPVLIIQRHIRGYLARSRYQYEQEKRLWAAVTIQRFYREYKGLEIYKHQMSVHSRSYLGLSSQRLDYDTYIRYRRSQQRSIFSSNALPSVMVPNDDSAYGKDRKDRDHQFLRVDHPRRLKVKLHIDLKELETSTSKIIDESWDGGFAPERNKIRSRKSKKETSSSNVQRKPFDTDLLGKFTAMNLMQLDRESKDIERKAQKEKKIEKQAYVPKVGDEDDGNIPFRLSGICAPRMTGDLLEELTRTVVEGARDIRKSIKMVEDDMHRKTNPVIDRSYPVTTDQKLFIRTHGTMALSCFRAVDQAYKDRDRAKALSEKVTRVLAMKQKRELSSKIRQHSKFMSIAKIHSDASQAKNELMQVMSDYKDELEEKREVIAIERNEREKRGKQRRKNHGFALEFTCQNNVISKALASHSAEAAKDKIVHVKQEKTQSAREDVFRQKEIIKRYTEHRNLLLQSEVSLSRSKLDSDLIERSIEQKKWAKLQVMKARNRPDIRREASLPCVATAPPRLPPLAIVADSQLSTWENTRKKKVEPRVHDRFNIYFS